jgi:hypothetical protein
LVAFRSLVTALADSVLHIKVHDSLDGEPPPMDHIRVPANKTAAAATNSAVKQAAAAKLFEPKTKKARIDDNGKDDIKTKIDNKNHKKTKLTAKERMELRIKTAEESTNKSPSAQEFNELANVCQMLLEREHKRFDIANTGYNKVSQHSFCDHFVHSMTSDLYDVGIWAALSLLVFLCRYIGAG